MWTRSVGGVGEFAVVGVVVMVGWGVVVVVALSRLKWLWLRCRRQVVLMVERLNWLWLMCLVIHALSRVSHSLL